MEPKLAPESMNNGFQDALNKKDDKWSEKSHAVVRRVVRARGVGSLESIHPEAPRGPA